MTLSIVAIVAIVAIGLDGNRPTLPPAWRLLIVTGFVGGLKTFSTFSAEVVSQSMAGRMMWARSSIAADVAGVIATTLLGIGTVALLCNSQFTTRRRMRHARIPAHVLHPGGPASQPPANACLADGGGQGLGITGIRMSDPRPAAAPQLIVPASMPAGVWVLGFVSMLMDISSEMIHSLLPLFLVGTLGVSVLAVGIIEGLAESTALISKVFSGALSDYLGKRKGLAVLGYAMGALTKPVFALANGVGMVVAARFIDRVGKGIRGAPRDALLADITPPSIRGAAFGLRQSLDTVGAFAGPLLATGLMLAWANDFRAVFWVAVIPGVLAVLLLLVGIREPEHDRPRGAVNPIRRESLARLDSRYWWVVGVGAVFTLARFSEAFLVLRASQLGVPVAWVPLVMVAMNLVYAASAYPFGKLSDTMSHGKLLAAGLVVLIVSDLVLASASSWVGLGLGVALWGVHMGMTQGLLAAMVADTAPDDLRGTAYGLFNLLGGLALLLSSVIAGVLWDTLGSAFTFYAGAGFAALTLLGMALRPAPKRPR